MGAETKVGGVLGITVMVIVYVVGLKESERVTVYS